MLQKQKVFIEVSDSDVNEDDYLQVTHWVEQNRNGQFYVEQLSDRIIFTPEELQECGTKIIQELIIKIEGIAQEESRDFNKDIHHSYIGDLNQALKVIELYNDK